MAKKINCKDCGKYLGEIRDAKLSKNIVYKCKDCDKPYKGSQIFDDPEVIDKVRKIFGLN